MRWWSWRGAVALVLAVCVGGGFAVALVTVATNPDIERPAATIVYVLGGTLIGGLVGWLARNDKRGGDDE